MIVGAVLALLAIMVTMFIFSIGPSGIGDFFAKYPEYVQPAGTLLAATIAGSAALWVAYRVYPVQKRADRGFKVDDEKRAAIADFIGASGAYVAAVDLYSRMNRQALYEWKILPSDKAYSLRIKEYDDFEKAKGRLIAYADAIVLEKAAHYVSAIMEYRLVAGRNLRRARSRWNEDVAPKLQIVSDRRRDFLRGAHKSFYGEIGISHDDEVLARLYPLGKDYECASNPIPEAELACSVSRKEDPQKGN